MRVAASVSVLLAASVVAQSACAPDEGRRRRAREPAAHAAEPVPAGGDDRPRDAPVVFDDGPAAPLSRAMLLRDFETVAIAPPAPPAEARPRRRGGRVDIELNGAPFVDTVRMLADVGRFDVVIEGPNATGVQASLHGVDAWDALVAICRAKGVAVRWERGIAIVGGHAARED